MKKIRLLSRLDIKSPHLVKGVHLEGLRKVGNPHEFAKKYYELGIDEILYIDIVASLYERNSLLDLIQESSADVFIPITVGGGLRSTADVQQVLRHGADKVAINTAALKNPSLINEVAEQFGSQCLVLMIEAKQTGLTTWEAYYDNGRERSGREVIAWAQECEQRGAGELLLTSVDREGTQKGFDLELMRRVSDCVNIPVIASGGYGQPQDLVDVVHLGRADAVAIAHAFHFDKVTPSELRTFAASHDIRTR